MKKTIIVPYALYDKKDERVSVPVTYEIKQDGNRTTYACSIDEARLPEWLTIKDFEIPTVYRPGEPGVHVTEFSAIKGIGNVDTALFVGAVHSAIFLRESWEARHQ